jgi:hypothetical protein
MCSSLAAELCWVLLYPTVKTVSLGATGMHCCTCLKCSERCHTPGGLLTVTLLLEAPADVPGPQSILIAFFSYHA